MTIRPILAINNIYLTLIAQAINAVSGLSYTVRTLLKYSFLAVFVALVLPFALLSGLGRVEGIFIFFGQIFALAPGLPGDYLRIAYYRLTLTEASLSSRIQFGSFFAHPQARLSSHVYIGSYCILGRTDIGERTHIASGVQIPSGRHQHPRHEDGSIGGAEHGTVTTVSIGKDCWIGAGAIVMADVGAASTIGAGSVVTRPIPAGCVAVGSPARVVETPTPKA